jgi:hypothetical protein
MDTNEKLGQYFAHSFNLLSRLNPEAISQEDYYEICLETLKINGQELECIEPEGFSTDQYLHLCAAAIEQDPFALEWVDESALGVENYQNICLQAVKKNGYALYFAKKDQFENEDWKLRILYKYALKQNTNALQLIQDQVLPMCRMAVRRNQSALQWVNPNLFSKEEYGEICHLAFYQRQVNVLLDRIFGYYFDIKCIQDYQALRFVRKDHLLPEKYKEICLLAIKYSAESLPFVDKSLWEDRGFCKEALKVSNKAKKYISPLTYYL